MDALIKFLLTQWAGAPLVIWFLGVPTVLAMIIVWKTSPLPKGEPDSKPSLQRKDPQPTLGNARNGKKPPFLRARREVGRLNAVCQFWWGFFGGFMVFAFRVWIYANALAPDTPWPNACFRTCLLCGVWFAFPFISGLVGRVCDPHYRLLAVFEGASAPALFLAIARDFPLP
jgi:hypothetical protein